MAQPLIVSRVRTVLYKQNYQGFTKEQILEAAKALNIDANNPTAEDTKTVANYLIEHSSSNITPSENPSENEETDSFISVTKMNSDEQLTNDNQRKPLDLLDEVIQETQEGGGAITPSQKADMISERVSALGFVLTDENIQSIAQSIEIRTKDDLESLAIIDAAIRAFIIQQDNIKRQNIDNMMDGLNNFAEGLDQNTANYLGNRLNGYFSNQYSKSGIDFKSKLRDSLKNNLPIQSTVSNS